MQDEEWSRQTGTILFRKILERRIDEIYEEMIGVIPGCNSVESVGLIALKAISRIEGLVQAIDESRYDESDGRESSGEIPEDE